MSMEREGEPVLNSGPHADAHKRTEDLQGKLDRLRAVIARERELKELSKLEKGDSYWEELSEAASESSDIFFEFATQPLKSDIQFSIIATYTKYLMEEDNAEYIGPIEDAIDTILHKVIDETTTPLATGLLAIARYRIESQRRQLANA